MKNIDECPRARKLYSTWLIKNKTAAAVKTGDVQCSTLRGSVHMRDMVKIDRKYDLVFVK